MVVGRAQEVDDEVELVDLRLARQERFVRQQLAQDAARGPHVDRRRLDLSRKRLENENIWRILCELD